MLWSGALYAPSILGSSWTRRARSGALYCGCRWSVLWLSLSHHHHYHHQLAVGRPLFWWSGALYSCGLAPSILVVWRPVFLWSGALVLLPSVYPAPVAPCGPGRAPSIVAVVGLAPCIVAVVITVVTIITIIWRLAPLYCGFRYRPCHCYNHRLLQSCTLAVALCHCHSCHCFHQGHSHLHRHHLYPACAWVCARACVRAVCARAVRVRGAAAAAGGGGGELQERRLRRHPRLGAPALKRLFFICI
jgi:hypothetical protein